MTPEEIVQDFRKRYEGTYVYVQEPNSAEDSLFFLDRVEAGTDKLGVFHLTSNEVGQIRLNFGSAHTIKFIPVPVGVFQHGGNAFFCLRRPQRQWRRGICNDNTKMATTPSAITRDAYQLTYDLVADAFKGITFPFKEALQKLATGKYRSIALTGHFSLSLSFTTTSKDYVLFFWNVPVARISSDGAVVRVLEAAFTQQINKVITS